MQKVSLCSMRIDYTLMIKLNGIYMVFYVNQVKKIICNCFPLKGDPTSFHPGETKDSSGIQCIFISYHYI